MCFMLEAKHLPCQVCPGQWERHAKTSQKRELPSQTLGSCKKKKQTYSNYQYPKHTKWQRNMKGTNVCVFQEQHFVINSEL